MWKCFWSTRFVKAITYASQLTLLNLQIKNIKLHIVTDIKVTINSLSVFGFRYLVGGRAIYAINETITSIFEDLDVDVFFSCICSELLIVSIFTCWFADRVNKLYKKKLVFPTTRKRNTKILQSQYLSYWRIDN